MPLAFTQEDFLVVLINMKNVNYFETQAKLTLQLANGYIILRHIPVTEDTSLILPSFVVTNIFGLCVPHRALLN